MPNNIGFLRLSFATLVIISHSFELIDGNRSREPLASSVGIITLGELAVYGFFLISGYLIVQSFDKSTSPRSYLWKRIRRIYPGYLVAYLVSIYIVGLFANVGFAAISVRGHGRILLEALLLKTPSVPAFLGLPYPSLNGSMWSIAYEFRCYVLVILFAGLGLYRFRWLFLAFTVMLLAIAEANLTIWAPTVVRYFLLGEPSLLIKLLSFFCVGTCFYLFRNCIVYNGFFAALSAGLFAASLKFMIAEEACAAVLGGYIVFWASFKLKSELMASANRDNDISYGVYLYAWPIQMLLIYYLQTRQPWLVVALTIPLSYVSGLVSWHLVEKRFTRSPRSSDRHNSDPPHQSQPQATA